jgi:hypothetical protein
MNSWFWFFSSFESRYIHLKAVLAAYKNTGIPLLENIEGNYVPTTSLDDIGIYLVIPKLVSFLNISLNTGIILFFYGALTLALACGLIGCYFLYDRWLLRICAGIQLIMLTLFSMYIGDLYIFYVVPILALIPWILYIAQYSQTFNYRIFTFCFLSGILLSFCHYVRLYSGLPVFVFLVIIILSQPWSIKEKLYTFTAIGLGAFLPYLYISLAKYKLSSFMKLQGIKESLWSQHLIWHTIYCGLGFLKFSNRYNIKYHDSSAVDLVQGTIQDMGNYESIVCDAFINLIKQDSWFCIMTLFAKLGVLLLFFLLFSHVGLLLRCIYKKYYSVDTAFFIALAASSIFPLLSIPALTYSLSFIALSCCYALVGISEYLTERFYKKRAEHECRI